MKLSLSILVLSLLSSSSVTAVPLTELPSQPPICEQRTLEEIIPQDSAIQDLWKRRGLPRQSQLNGAPNAKSWFTMTTLEAGDSRCLFAQVGVDGSVPYPVRFEFCSPLKDDALWQFVPDSKGAYFVYNKAWQGTSQRLDINCQELELCIMWMGPSDEKYNNQRWFLDQSGDTFHVTSLGLPGSSMVSEELDGEYVSLMQNTSKSSENSLAWKLIEINAELPSIVPSSSIVADRATDMSSETTALSQLAATVQTETQSTTAQQIDNPSRTSAPPTLVSSVASAPSATSASPGSPNSEMGSSSSFPWSSSISSSVPSSSTLSSLAPGSSSSSPPPANITSNTTNKRTEDGLSASALAGIIASCAVVLIILLICFIWFRVTILKFITRGRYPNPTVTNSNVRKSLGAFPATLMENIFQSNIPTRA